MNNRNVKLLIIQAAVVLFMTTAAAYSLFSYIESWTMAFTAGLLLLGAATISFPRMGALPFSLPVLSAAFPEIFNHSLLDFGLGGIRGETGRISVFENLSPELSFILIAVIGLVIISGYLILSHTCSLQKDYQNMLSGGIGTGEAGQIIDRNLTVIWTALAAGSVIAVIITAVLIFVQPVVTAWFEEFTWRIIVFGLAAVLLLAGFIYRVGVQNKG